RACLPKPCHDLGVLVDDPRLEIRGPPRRGHAFGVEQILHPVRQPVQRPPVPPGGDLRVGLRRVGVIFFALMSAESRCAGRNASSSSDVGTGPSHFSTANAERSNALAPCSLTSFSMSAPVPPGYGMNCSAGGSPLPSGSGGVAGCPCPPPAPPPCARTTCAPNLLAARG